MVKENRDSKNVPLSMAPSLTTSPAPQAVTAVCSTNHSTVTTTIATTPTLPKNNIPLQIKEEITDDHPRLQANENNAKREDLHENSPNLFGVNSTTRTNSKNIKIENNRNDTSPSNMSESSSLPTNNNDRKEQNVELHLHDVHKLNNVIQQSQIKEEGPDQAHSQQQNQNESSAPSGINLNQIPPNNRIESNKQSNSMEYSQQQSQIFVFSTALANKGADAVLNGHFSSIIAYHCAQPGTKKFLEKYPLKLAQFSRQSPAHWFNNLAMMKTNRNVRSSSNKFQPPPQQIFTPNISNSSDEILNELSSWTDPHSQDNNRMGLDNIAKGINENSLMTDQDVDNIVSDNHSPPINSSASANNSEATSPSLLMNSAQPSLQGVKVPDENLTPQQRQHREEQLATIRRMQKIFFPEHGGPGVSNIELTQLQQRMDQESQQKMQAKPRNQQNNPPMSRSNASIPQNHPHDNNMISINDINSSEDNPQNLLCNIPGQNMGMGEYVMNAKGMMLENSVQAQMEWHKLQNQYYEERKGKHIAGELVNSINPNMMGMMSSMHVNRHAMIRNICNSISNMRPHGPGHGPPPPYHLTTRSASVPIALKSPNPASPNNPTSNLSLPSPRGAGNNSSLNSPDSSAPGNVRQMTQSNPGTPITTNLSPNAALKDLDNSSQNSSAKETNLMPVPSPQQIQYLNSFEGQELTIQKQPNSNLKDSNGNNGSNKNASASLDNNNFQTQNTDKAAPLQSSESTPSSDEKNPKQRTRTPSTSGGEPNNSTQNSGKNSNDAGPQHYQSASPNLNYSPGPLNSHQGMKKGNFLDLAPNIKCSTNSPSAPSSGPNPGYPCTRTDNIPLNPNSTITVNSKSSHFDPISSLAQMSQQLTSSATSSLIGGHMGGAGCVIGGFTNQGMTNPSEMPPIVTETDLMSNGPMDCVISGMSGIGGIMAPGLGYGGGMIPNSQLGHGGSIMSKPLSPKLGGSMGIYHGGQPQGMTRFMGRSPINTNSAVSPYNGANIQVKASAPNTIQYLPARPQIGNQNPRGPPSLEFLQRFANPTQNLDGMHKMPNQQGMPFYNSQQGGPGSAIPCGPGMPGIMDGIGNMNEGLGIPMMGMNPQIPPGAHIMMGQGIMMRGLRTNQNNMLRMQGIMGNNHQLNGPGNNEQLFCNSGPGGQNVFVPNPGKGGAEQLQSINNQGNNIPGQNCNSGSPSNQFKSSQFVGPTTTDPNYAQQYHNFQQQLYATNTRNQVNAQIGSNVGGNNGQIPQSGVNLNQAFFVPK